MIYFIRAGVHGPIKIGFAARDCLSRLTDLQTGHYERLTLIATIDGTLKEEHALHKKYARFNIRGEWFESTKELEAEIRELIGREFTDITVDGRNERGYHAPPETDPNTVRGMIRMFCGPRNIVRMTDGRITLNDVQRWVDEDYISTPWRDLLARAAKAVGIGEPKCLNAPITAALIEKYTKQAARGDVQS